MQNALWTCLLTSFGLVSVSFAQVATPAPGAPTLPAARPPAPAAAALVTPPTPARAIAAPMAPPTRSGSGNSNANAMGQFPPGTPLNDVLDFYQQLAGKRLIKDARTDNATIGMETTGQFTKEEAMDFIEKSLLFNGYALVPAGKDLLKVIAFEGGKIPSSEGVPMILSEEELPITDQVVSYILPLTYLKAEDASTAFAQIIPPHAYGKLIAVPNARAMVITENSNTIRSYIELAKQVDVPTSETKVKTIPLERADAEEVAEILASLLGIDQGTTTGGTSGGGVGRPNAAIQPNVGIQPRPINPQQAAAMNAAGIPPAGPATGTVGTGEAEAAPPKIQALQRTNSILVIARPLDIQYIESIIKELDAPSEQRGFVSRKLRYMDVVDFVNVAKDALLRGAKDDSGGNGLQAGGGANQTTSTTTSTNSGFGNSGFGNNSSGFGGSSGGFGGASSMSGGMSGGGGGSSLQETQQAKTQSVLIGKTLLIVDPPSSQFFASGPPEQLRVLNELADELDKRPRQILLSAVIGEYTVGDDLSFGLDWVHTLENVGKDSLVGGAINTSGGEFPDFSSFGSAATFPALQGLTVYGKIGKHLNTFLSALEATNKFRVLQKPTVSTVNHKLASISIGQQLAIPGETLTTTGNSGINGNSVASTTQYIRVELMLNIIPHIYANDEVRLDFEQQNFDVASFTTISGNEVPNLATQSLKNTIIVPNNNTVLLGGLIRERDRGNNTGLPLLVKIPVLKHLFGSTTKGKERRELMIFVQPRILADGVDHVEEQSDWAKKTESYESALQFADPKDPQPLEAHPPSDGLGRTQGISTPILPLPGWQAAEERATRSASVKPQGLDTSVPPKATKVTVEKTRTQVRSK